MRTRDEAVHGEGRVIDGMLYANSGGPMSRTRTERIVASLLGDAEGYIICPLQLTLALDFGSHDPREFMEQALREFGFEDPEELRDVFEVPGPMLCCVDPKIPARPVATLPLERLLRDALLLGLSTAVYFDPSRPVLWTEASLTRRIRLYESSGFYA